MWWRESRELRGNPKQEAWDELYQEIETIVDRRGMRIDPGIKETVVALRALGLRTDGSCEGHVDNNHRLKAPWVDVGGCSEDLTRRVREAQRRGEPLDADLEKAGMAERARILEEESRILDLLESFYRDRNVPIRRRLIAHIYPTTARIMSQGAELQDMYPPEAQQQNLREFQEEMSAFTEFLRTSFFGS